MRLAGKDPEHMREDGSLVIMFALVLPVMLLMVFGSIDIAHMVLVKRELQKIADMSAIAAAEGIGSGVQTIALQNAQQNGLPNE
ncbi:MAG: pilus assembly protein, partial [Acidithiobacillus sp.]|nr:pilus assembly protein [Acidithiobacillus sp.]